MNNFKCTDCCFFGSRYDRDYGTRKYVCHHKKTFGRTVTLGRFDNSYILIDDKVPSWCPILKSEFNVVGTLEHVCSALSRANTIIDFSILEHDEIKYCGELSKFLEKDWHYKAWKMYDVISFTCEFKLLEGKFVNFVTLKITSKCIE